MRKTITALTISLGLLLALATGVSAFAQATPTQSPNERDAQPQATAPSQSTTPSQTAPENQGSPSSAPQTTAPPSSAPQSGGPQTSAPPAGSQGNAQQGENKGVDIDKELGLTDDQKQKIATIVDDENRQIAAVRDDNAMPLEQKQQKVLEIRRAGTPKIKAILTPEQLQKLAALQQRMRDQQNGTETGSPGGTQNPPQTPPQH
jgi:Spy/CpxP family protein refolding chaperone